jgi:hypothetical protein
MGNLNTQDFVKAYTALDNAKYPNLNNTANEHVIAVLSVSVEFGLSLDEIQNRFDILTSGLITELADYLAKEGE